MTDSVIIHRSGDWAFYQGVIYGSGKLFVCDAGTTNLRTIYTDNDLTGGNEAANPIVADSAGLFAVRYTGTSDYKIVLKTSDATSLSDGTTILTMDNLPGAIDTSTFAAASFAATDENCAADTGDTTLTTGMLGTVRNGNPTSASFTYTLPSAVTATNGRGYTIRHTGTANQINIATVSSQTIDGITTKAVLGRYESITLVSDGANWHVTRDANRTVYGGTLLPQGYLTLVSATPIITSDQSAVSAVYYTPFVGNLVPIYDGTRFVMYPFAELTLSLVASHLASQIYDVFVWLESNVVTIGTGPAWATPTAGSGARGTGAGTTQLTRQNGIHINTVAMTTRNGSTTYSVSASRATYLGSLYMDGTNGQISSTVSFGQNRKWGVWNAFNRQKIILKAGDATASWNYNSATIRQANGATGNKITVFTGLAEEYFDARIAQRVTAGGGGNPAVGIGWDSTTAFSGHAQSIDSTAALIRPGIGSHVNAPILGISNVNLVERGDTGSTTLFGGEDDQQLVVEYRG